MPNSNVHSIVHHPKKIFIDCKSQRHVCRGSDHTSKTWSPSLSSPRSKVSPTFFPLPEKRLEKEKERRYILLVGVWCRRRHCGKCSDPRRRMGKPAWKCLSDRHNSKEDWADRASQLSQNFNSHAHELAMCAPCSTTRRTSKDSACSTFIWDHASTFLYCVQLHSCSRCSRSHLAGSPWCAYVSPSQLVNLTSLLKRHWHKIKQVNAKVSGQYLSMPWFCRIIA